jgi:acetyl esterase/lipase
MSVGAVVLALVPQPSQAQQSKPAPKQVPDGVKAQRDIDYTGAGKKSQMLDLYVPERASALLPVVIWIHGGSWRSGSKEGCPALPLTTRGYAVASINYRLTDEAVFPAQIEDCRAAIRWLRSNASKYHIDPSKIGVWGASAGGHLAALLGTAADAKGWDGVGNFSDQSTLVQAVCDYFGPVDFLHKFNPDRASGPNSPVARLLGGPLKDKQEDARTASPLTYVSKGDSPFLIVHGDMDALVPLDQSRLLLDALKKNGVSAQLIVVTNGKHGPFGAECDPNPDQIRASVFGFFDRNLKK